MTGAHTTLVPSALSSPSSQVSSCCLEVPGTTGPPFPCPGTLTPASVQSTHRPRSGRAGPPDGQAGTSAQRYQGMLCRLRALIKRPVQADWAAGQCLAHTAGRMEAVQCRSLVGGGDRPQQARGRGALALEILGRALAPLPAGALSASVSPSGGLPVLVSWLVQNCVGSVLCGWRFSWGPCRGPHNCVCTCVCMRVCACT